MKTDFVREMLNTVLVFGGAGVISYALLCI